MGIRVVWDDDEKTVVRHIYEGTWTWRDFREAVHKAWAMMHTVDHTVDAILDLRNGDVIPKGSALYQAKYVVRHRPANGGVIVFVGASPFLKALGRTFDRVYSVLASKTVIFWADDLEQARELLSMVERIPPR